MSMKRYSSLAIHTCRDDVVVFEKIVIAHLQRNKNEREKKKKIKKRVKHQNPYFVWVSIGAYIQREISLY